jgi:hypothetical protein
MRRVVDPQRIGVDHRTVLPSLAGVINFDTAGEFWGPAVEDMMLAKWWPGHPPFAS